jgi:two-component sensor histidine kinase
MVGGVGTNGSADEGRAIMVSFALPLDLRSAAEARRLLVGAVRDHESATGQHGSLSTDRVRDAVLMVSELITNAVRHTRTRLALEISFEGPVLRVAVHDDAPGLPAAPAEDLHATGGRGLRIVAALSRRWGWTPVAHGKAVWFEISCR